MQPVNERNSNDASGPCAPSKSSLSVGSTGSCGTKLPSEKARAPSDLHESIPVPSVDGSGAHSIKSQRLAVSSGIGGASILENLSESSGGSCGKDTHLAEQCLSHSLRSTRLLHTSTRFNLKFSLESSWCHVPRTSAERDGTGRRDSASPRRTREPNGKLNVNCWLNLKSATKLLKPGNPHRREFSWYHARQSPPLPSCMATPMCFFANSVEPSTLVAL